VAYSRPKQNTIVIYLCLLLLAVTGTYQLVSELVNNDNKQGADIKFGSGSGRTSGWNESNGDYPC